MGKRRNYRVNADSWSHLRDILVGTPEDFNSDRASLYGRTVNLDMSPNIYTGWMPPEHANAMRDSVVRFIIYSYQTPIAYWRIADWNKDGSPNYEWVIPDVRYSVTTSKHQGKVRTAISCINEAQNV